MARQKFNDGMEVVFEDSNKLQARLQQELYDRTIFELLEKVENAFFGESFDVNYVSPTSVTVQAGTGFQTDATVASSEPQKRLLYRATSPTLNLTTPDGAQDRIDIVVVKHALVDGPTEARKYKDAGTSVISTENLVTTQDWEAELLIVAGTPSGSPVEPAVPAGYIKLASLYVTAVTGMSGSGDVTDARTLLPVGVLGTMNTAAFSRLTAGASTTISQLMTDIDALMVAGKMTTNIFADSAGVPANPPNAGDLKMFNNGGLMFTVDNAGSVNPLGSGGGGGGGLIWTEPDGSAPVLDEEFSQDVYLFAKGLAQKLVVYLTVPAGYIAGRQIKMLIAAYSPSNSNNFLLKADIGLIRKNNDPVDTPGDSDSSTNTALTNTVANQYRQVVLDLTDALGKVNTLSVSPGDLLKVELSRGTDTDTAEVRFVPSATEVNLS